MFLQAYAIEDEYASFNVGLLWNFLKKKIILNNQKSPLEKKVKKKKKTNANQEFLLKTKKWKD